MKPNRIKQLSTLLIGLLLAQLTIAQENNFSGNWSGKITIPTGKLEMIFKITRADGKYQAKLDVPKQGASDLPVGDVLVIGDSVSIAVPAIMGTYAGHFSTGDSITGKWKQSGMTFDVNLIRIGEVAALVRPQTPEPPFPYLSEEVEYTNPESGLKLAGTITFPKDAKACPAVVMITGSGAQDRDEVIFGHKPFAVIADFLTRNGIAVLRVDDRGVGGSEGSVSESTSLDFVGDVLAGVDFLKSREEIDPKKIGLIGHSEGGLIAPIAATKSNDIAFIVMMAGPGTVGEQILYEQGALLSKAAGLPDYSIEQQKLTQQKIFEVVKSEADQEKAKEQLRETLSQGMYAGMNEDLQKTIDAEISNVNSTWFRFFLTYDPKPTLSKVKCPVLALNGSKDLQVPVSNLGEVIKAVNSGGNMKVDTVRFINHNHLFQQCETGAIAEYAQIEETIDPEVLKTMKDWILEQTKK
ncbi:alpha/beta fold hydrolase [Draconibacterium sp. IB214405]|uniref:alpha/beta hydrolase family protein n=1 Tax=Draconibacterium sp. IB214405 TaxID=3097352 RepID=UPI002A0E7561|nr:alpha/beta fold hydrolase [Draconibacterium sp. IB214405]MDX8340958.1 alpha/beta fold hydrolase [Draconibacterium sp. IB214405]